MKFHYKNNADESEFLLFNGDVNERDLYYENTNPNKFYAIAWNHNKEQIITIDEIKYLFPANSILPLVGNQTYKFAKPKDIRLWQFNREFYCILNHDKEVGCIGYIFYGSSADVFINIDEEEKRKIDTLYQVFIDEFNNKDNLQGDMLRMLLVRLIIHITRLAKQQFLPNECSDIKYNLIRNYNLLVEDYFRQEHSVQFYADLLHKSPKTISNLFAKHSDKTPLQIIQDRVILEAKRLYHYTEKSTKEIASELGFNDAANFSRFFKNQTGLAPTEFKVQSSTQIG